MSEGTEASRFARLTTLDRMFLRRETPDWPGHFGGLALVEGNGLQDGSGRLRLAEIGERVENRLSQLMSGMERDWHGLVGAHPAEPAGGGKRDVEASAAAR